MQAVGISRWSSLDHSSEDEKKSDVVPNAYGQQPFNTAPYSNEEEEEVVKSRGVAEMDLLQSRLTKKSLIILYGAFTLLAYVMSLDQYTSATYLSTATSVAFNAHSVLATVNVVKSVTQAVSQPPIAKLSDVFGRVETYGLCVLFYTVGYIIVSASTSIYMYSVGNCIYIVGITGLFLLQNIIISDTSSLRNRVFWSIFPSVPGAINVWVSGDVASAVLKNSTWRWGYGMFCILVPIMSTPIILTLAILTRKAKKDPNAINDDAIVKAATRKPRQSLSFKDKAFSIFWELDIVGLLFFVAGFGLFLVAITLANSKRTTWSSPQSLAMLIVGAGLVAIFVLWECFGARTPIIPFRLLTNRTVVGCILVSTFHPAAGGIAGGYLYTWLLVAADQSVKSSTRIRSIPQFVALFSALGSGYLVRYTRRLKPIIFVGMAIEVLGIGLMIKFRTSQTPVRDLIGIQIVRGIGAGMVSFPNQAAIQSAVTHQYTASITACLLVVHYLSSAFGSAIGGGIWTNEVPFKLDAYMNNATLSNSAYANPVGFADKWAYDTPQRQAVARAHDETQRLMCIVGTCVAALAMCASLLQKNLVLTDDQSLPEEGNHETEANGEIRPPANAINTNFWKKDWWF